MKAWKIIAVTVFVFIAVALITASALAYNPMRGSMRGPMGCGYSQYINYPSSSGYPQQNSTTRQHGSWTGGCGMRNGWP